MNWLLLLTSEQPPNEFDLSVYYDNTYFRNSYHNNNSIHHDNDHATSTVISNLLSDLLDRYLSSTCLGIPQSNVSKHYINHISSIYQKQHDHNQTNNKDSNEHHLFIVIYYANVN